MLGEILLKLANGDKLSEQEKLELSLVGNETQQRNLLISNIFDVNGRPTFKNGLTADGDVYVGKNLISPVSARVKRDSDQTIATGTSASYIQFETVEYNDGLGIDLATDNTKINILTSGIYSIIIGVAWDVTLTTSYGEGGVLLNGSTSIFPVSRLPAVAGLVSTAIDERALSAGDYLKLYARQETGGSRDVVSSFMTIKKIR